MTKSDHKIKIEKTITVRQRDANLVPIVWQVSHMVGYALTAVISAVCSIVFYLAVAKSTYRCYLYNEAIVVQEFSRERNHTVLKNERIWYKNMNCYDPFMFSLIVSFGSIMWMSLFLVFGRGGSLIHEEFEHTKYFSDMVGQWQVVFFASCFNFWFCLQSIKTALHFTNGYQLFVATLSYVATDDYFRHQFENFEKMYYTKAIVLVWCQSAFCTFNFLLVVYRCAMGVDFVVHLKDDDDDDDEQDDLMIAGPSNQTKTNATHPVILYGHIKLDYVSSRHENTEKNLKPEE